MPSHILFVHILIHKLRLGELRKNPVLNNSKTEFQSSDVPNLGMRERKIGKKRKINMSK